MLNHLLAILPPQHLHTVVRVEIQKEVISQLQQQVFLPVCRELLNGWQSFGTIGVALLLLIFVIVELFVIVVLRLIVVFKLFLVVEFVFVIKQQFEQFGRRGLSRRGI